MTSAWKAIRGDSRRSSRSRLRLSASVLPYEGIEDGRWPAVLASTADVSRDGLSLIIPTFGVWYHALQDRAISLRITLALPNGTTANLLGTCVYCQLRKETVQGNGYLVGVRLLQSEELAIYHEFIDALVPNDGRRQLLSPAIASWASTLALVGELVV